MKKTLISLSLLFLISAFGFAEEKLIFVTMITRHGDRTPFSNIKNANYHWKTGMEQLTPIGMNEEYNVGKLLRKRYIEEMKLLEPNYINDSIYTVSSDTNRTIQSAESLLTGLYPPGTGPKLENGKPALPDLIQTIPIRTVPASSSLIMMPYPRYIKILSKYIYPSKVWQDKQKEYESKFKEWTKILGNKITNLADVLSIGDVLIVARHHDLKLPKGLSEADAEDIIKLTSWGLSTQFKSEKVSYLCNGPLVNLMIKNLKDAANKKAPYKMVYYSGHDITILPVMCLLGAPLDKSPGYASHMQLELYQKDETTFIIKLRYNDKQVKLPIMGDKDFCTLEELEKHIDAVNAKYETKSKPID